MATLDTARKLLEDLRVASYPAAGKELEEVRQFAKDQVRLFSASFHGGNFLVQFALLQTAGCACLVCSCSIFSLGG
jgi:hypothetical protein